MLRIRRSTQFLFATMFLLPAAVAQAQASGEEYKAGAKVEVREGDSWTAATFLRKEGRKSLIKYDDGTEEWVTADRLRKPGTAGAVVPAPAAGAKTPVDSGTPAVSPKSVVTIDSPYTALDLDDATEPPTTPAAGAPKFNIPTTKPAYDFRAVQLTQKVKRDSIDRLIPCVDSPGIAVVSCGTVFSDTPEVMRVDLLNKRKIGSYLTNVKGQHVTSAADGGRLILTKKSMGWDPQLHLWELEGDAYRLRANYDPFGDKSTVGKGLALATLLDANRAVFAAKSGEVYLVDLKTNKAKFMIRGSGNATPYVHPSGQLVGVLTATGSVLLVRSTDFSTIAEIPDADSRGDLSVDPTGTAVAFPGNDGAVHIANIADGAALGAIPNLASTGTNFDLVSPDRLIAGGSILYDVKQGYPIWAYKRTSHIEPDNFKVLANGQIAMLLGMFDEQFACAVSIPPAKAPPVPTRDTFMLMPDTSVTVSGDFSAFGDTAKATETVKDQLKAAGLKPVATGATFDVVASVSAGPTVERTFHRFGPGGSRDVSCPSTLVKVQLMHDGVAVWEQTLNFSAMGGLQIGEGKTMQQAADEAAKPNLGGLKGLRFPPYLPKGSTVGSVAAPGSSDVTPKGIVAPPK